MKILVFTCLILSFHSYSYNAKIIKCNKCQNDTLSITGGKFIQPLMNKNQVYIVDDKPTKAIKNLMESNAKVIFAGSGKKRPPLEKIFAKCLQNQSIENIVVVSDNKLNIQKLCNDHDVFEKRNAINVSTCDRNLGHKTTFSLTHIKDKSNIESDLSTKWKKSYTKESI